MVDIMLDLERLQTAREGLASAIAEFEEASKINDGLEKAIARPDDRSALRDKASDFESAWNGKRGKLSENLQNIHEQLSSIVDGWQEWDSETAADIEAARETSTTNVRAV
ncbi:hypothetical protein [Microbacterium flavescens]|uniref:hypothetical protein n=1 Tax=Microbacterium flavescens TaxID=69366 RepID=UPI001BDF2915|nr:hypothetical protein [Microbacterium flavescens]BFF09087.1 hypothetical protein GCM10025699_03900 [Microbacterium flavescens]